MPMGLYLEDQFVNRVQEVLAGGEQRAAACSTDRMLVGPRLRLPRLLLITCLGARCPTLNVLGI